MPANERPPVLFVQSKTIEHGGRAAVFAWMLQALRDDHELTVFTWKPFDVGALNDRYGTSLHGSDVHFLMPPLGARCVAALVEAVDPDPGSIQRTLLLARAARRLAPAFALTIGCEMESDFGVPGLQYIHFPWLARFYSQGAANSIEGLNHWQKLLAVLQGRARPWQWMGDFSFQRMRLNRTLSNSTWTGDLLRRAYGIVPITLFPPAPGTFAAIPWDARANGFVALGRIHPEKRLDWIIEALAPLREEMPDLHLHLIGTAGSKKIEREYLNALRQLVTEHRSWVTLHLDLSRTVLSSLVAQQRYGVHAMVDEHFGIAVAEMVRGGCIPFVHRSGGAVEIVNGDAALTYDTAEELRARIVAVACNDSMQASLRDELARTSARFSPEQFMDDFRAIVAGTVREFSVADHGDKG